MPVVERDKYQIMMDSQKHWELDRPTMTDRNDDVLFIVSLLAAEVNELGEAVSQGDMEDIGQECADVFLFLLQIMSTCGLDLYLEVMEKRAYNMCRYTSGNFSNGLTYEQAVFASREQTKQMMLKDRFYKIQR